MTGISTACRDRLTPVPSTRRQAATSSCRWHRRRAAPDEAGSACVSFRRGSTRILLAAGAAGARAAAVEVPRAEAPFSLDCSLDSATANGSGDRALQRLNDLLAAGEWEEADNETRALLIRIAGEDAVRRKWVYFTEARAIQSDDLRALDGLWVHYSDGRYGYSVQRRLWMESGRRWAKFFKRIDWVQGENDAYRKWPEEFIWKADAKAGHLPLTNALRGTQLFQAILEHEAFSDEKK